MLHFWVLLCVYIISSTVAQEADDEYGEFNEWKASICAKNSNEFGEEMDKCISMDSPKLQDIVKKCHGKILPTVDFKTYDFLTAACAEQSLFIKLDECMKENEDAISAVPEEESTESITCIKELADKYGLL